MRITCTVHVPLWNRLSDDIKSSLSVRPLKTKLNEHIIPEKLSAYFDVNIGKDLENILF
jgi:hypothetical protein